jgi:hypothetical protein
MSFWGNGQLTVEAESQERVHRHTLYLGTRKMSTWAWFGRISSCGGDTGRRPMPLCMGAWS